MASRSFPMSWFFTSGCQSRSFSFSISPSKEYSGLISFRTDCLISMLSKQLSRVFSWHNNSKASILCYPAFFMVQLSHLYMSTGKTIPLTRWIFVSKVTSLLFNMLSVCHSFSSKEQMSFNFMAAVTILSDFEAQENKICYCFQFFHIICHEEMRPDSMVFIF